MEAKIQRLVDQFASEVGNYHVNSFQDCASADHAAYQCHQLPLPVQKISRMSKASHRQKDTENRCL